MDGIRLVMSRKRSEEFGKTNVPHAKGSHDDLHNYEYLQQKYDEALSVIEQNKRSELKEQLDKDKMKKMGEC